MDLTTLTSKKLISRYKKHLAAQKVPSATIKRKISSLNRFSAWAKHHYPHPPSRKLIQTRSKGISFGKLYQKYHSLSIASSSGVIRL